MVEVQTDVVICGAGPVGLLIALGLAQQGISTYVVEKREREIQAEYGRACTLYPRSIELLEQLNVADDLVQAGFVARASVTFKDGKRVTGRGWNSVFENMYNTWHDYVLNIRQRHSEDILLQRYATTSGSTVHYGHELVDFKVDKTLEDGQNVTVVIASSGTNDKIIVRCKYLIGADGGQSYVREHSGIAMEGDRTTYKWIRIDGKMQTDMPDANIGFAAIETPNHGNVLWVKLNKDAHRIGFALTPSLRAKYGKSMTEEQAIHETVEAIKPFKLKIERLDWWTCYSINQAVATTFQKDEFILLAGDAAHVHSSGFAQGMNTGIHDATNLIWKLSGTLKGWYAPCVLESYATERRLAALKLIGIDRLGAAAISGDIPEMYRAVTSSADEAVTKIFTDNVKFNLGLGVSYPLNAVTRAPLAGVVSAGFRGPDALLQCLGTKLPVRLYDVTRAGGRWSVLVFAGEHLLTRARFMSLRDALLSDDGDGPLSFKSLNLVTVLASCTGSAWNAFEGSAIGKLYLDLAGQGHDLYGFSRENGGVAVLRPDGILGFAAQLDQLDETRGFFAGFDPNA